MRILESNLTTVIGGGKIISRLVELDHFVNGGMKMEKGLLKLFDAEYKFMSIVWEHEPVNSTELTKLCETELGWKKPTTYSMIRKLCERGVMQNEKATVTTLIARKDVQKYEADVFIDRVFDGSVPSFITTFLQNKNLSEDETQEIKSMIDGVVKK